MESLKLYLACLTLILAGILPGSYHSANAAEVAQGSGSSSGNSLVFDPQTKKYFISGTAKFVLRPGDGTSLLDGIQLSLDGADYQPYQGAVQFNTEGKHVLKFRALNAINNWSPVQLMEVFVDMTAPATEAKFDGKTYKETDTTFVKLHSKINLNAQDNLSGIAAIEYSWDGTNYRPYGEPVSVEKSGAQSLYFRATDRVGNTEPAKHIEFVADGSAPYSTLKQNGMVRPINLKGKSYLSATDSVAFSIEAIDDGSKVANVWVSVDGQPISTFKKPIYFLQEGPHTLQYSAEDNVGNKEEMKSIAIYTVSSPPVTVASAVGKMVNTGGINYATSRFQLKLDTHDNIVGTDRVEVRVNDEKEFHPYLEPIRFRTVGPQTVAYRAVDHAGNFEPTKLFNVTVLETAPETTIETAQPLVVRDGISYSPAPNVVTLKVRNSEVGIDHTYVSLNDGAFKDYSGPITLTADRKVYKLTYRSSDKLGNEEQGKTVVYHMLNTIPIVDLFIENGKNQEEQVRTKYFESDKPARGAASEDTTPAAKPKKRH